MLENGVNIRVVQELMGHADVKTTEIYDAKREPVTGKEIKIMVFYREPGRKSIAGFTGPTRIGRIFSPASAEFLPGCEPPSAPGH